MKGETREESLACRGGIIEIEKKGEDDERTGFGSSGGLSDLPFQIHLAEGGSLCVFEQRPGLARQKHDSIIAVFEQVLALVIEDELSSVYI